MEDCCAICAEPLEWIAYGPCGHREVCSTCTARMRVVLNDKHCCICKQLCPSIYVTKALGDYTRSIADFSLLPQLLQNRNGKEKFWYESNVEGYFDDEEEYKRIKAMCKLYCVVCEKATVSEDAPKGFLEKGHTFKNLDLLRRHLYGVHKFVMCDLCLEGRKVFLCEQKLYTKAQLERHSSHGNSKVDGNQEERGGFAGHPMCDFCKRRFYGDNELYHHMSTEHYTCHICQRSRPGHFEYYRNYDDLEAHFRYEHVLCEDPECLAKKFVVFSSESELKRHNATAHGGKMTRAQRNAALQIPVSFQFRRSIQNTREAPRSSYRPGRRGRDQNQDASQFFGTSQLSSDTANLEEALRQSATLNSSSGDDSNRDILLAEGSYNFPALSSEGSGVNSTNMESESYRYLTAAQGAGPSALAESAFPPLPGVSKSARRRAKHRSQSAAALSMAALLGGSRVAGVRVLNTANLTQFRSSGAADTHSNGDESAISHRPGSHRTGSSEPVEFGLNHAIDSNIRGNVAVTMRGLDAPLVAGEGVLAGGNKEKVLTALDQEVGNQVLGKLSIDEIKAANRALVERIKVGLNGDELLFADFKSVSSCFRKGEMGCNEFYEHIVRLGLVDVVTELARLCPDPQKQEELMKVHTSRMMVDKMQNDTSWPTVASASSSSSSLGRTKAELNPKGKAHISNEDAEVSFPAAFLRSARAMQTKLQESTLCSSETTENLNTDGYRSAKGSALKTGNGSTTLPQLATNASDSTPQILVKAFQNSNLPSSSRPMQSGLEGSWACAVCTLRNPITNVECVACGSACPGTASDKNLVEDRNVSHKKKTAKIPKFERVRLGEGFSTALLDSEQQMPLMSRAAESSSSQVLSSAERSFGRGVWKNQGGERIRSIAHRESIIEEAYRSKG